MIRFFLHTKWNRKNTVIAKRLSITIYIGDRRFHNTDAHMRVFAINRMFHYSLSGKYTFLRLVGPDIVDDILIKTQ